MSFRERRKKHRRGQNATSCGCTFLEFAGRYFLGEKGEKKKSCTTRRKTTARVLCPRSRVRLRHLRVADDAFWSPTAPLLKFGRSSASFETRSGLPTGRCASEPKPSEPTPPARPPAPWEKKRAPTSPADKEAIVRRRSRGQGDRRVPARPRRAAAASLDGCGRQRAQLGGGPRLGASPVRGSRSLRRLRGWGRCRGRQDFACVGCCLPRARLRRRRWQASRLAAAEKTQPVSCSLTGCAFAAARRVGGLRALASVSWSTGGRAGRSLLGVGAGCAGCCGDSRPFRGERY